MLKEELLELLPLYLNQPSMATGKQMSLSYRTSIIRCMKMFLSDIKGEIPEGLQLKFAITQFADQYSKTSNPYGAVCIVAGVLRYYGLLNVDVNSWIKRYRPAVRKEKKALKDDDIVRVLKEIMAPKGQGVITKDNVRKGYIELTQIRTYIAVSIMLVTGIRRQQVLSIKKEDIEISDEWMTIRVRRMKNADDDWRYKYIPLDVKLPDGNLFIDMYNKYIQDPGLPASDWLFCNITHNRGFPVGIWTMSQWLRPYKVTAHTFRHTAATQMALATGNIVAVASLLDHQQLSTTERYIKIPVDSRQYVRQTWLKRDSI